MKSLPHGRYSFSQALGGRALPVSSFPGLFRVLPFTALFLFLSTFFSLYAQPPAEWDRDLGGEGEEQFRALQQTSDGGYILGGYSFSGISGDKSQASRGNADYWVVKLDAAGNKVWDKTFGGEEHDYLEDLQQTSDGGYILGGTSFSPISGDKSQARRGEEDYWVIKLDAAGNKVWDKTFGGGDEDRLVALQQTRDGGYILGGRSFSGTGGDKTQASRGQEDYWVIRLDAHGTKLWDKTFGGSEPETFSSLQQTGDGGFILGGTSQSGLGGDKTQASRGEADYWLVKLDAAGNKVWDRTFGGDSRDALQSVRQTTDGGYILGGNSFSGISGDKEIEKVCSDEDFRNSFMWVVKLNAAGNKQWEQLYGPCIDAESDSNDELRLVVPTGEGGYLIGGRANAGACDRYGCRDAYLLVKVDARGNLEWRDEINGRFFDLLSDVQQTADGGIVLGGSSNSPAREDKTEENIQVCDDDEDGYSTCAYDFWIVKRAPLPKGGQVESFTLIDTDREQPLQALRGGDTLNLATLPTLKLSVRANTILPRVGSVKFELSGQENRIYTDSEPPYALFGDKKGDYNMWTPSPGDYTLTATPFSGKYGKGETGIPLTMNWTVIYRETLPVVQRFVLINTESKQPIRELSDGQEIALAALLTRKLNIRADTGPVYVGSVKFSLSGRQSRTFIDNEAPFAVFGDQKGDYNKWTPPPGNYTLTATPYPRPRGQGRAGTPLTIHFRVREIGTQAVVQWDKTLGADSDEFSTLIRQTRDGGYILGGNSASGISGDKTGANRGDFDYWVVKLDASGKKIWDKTFGGAKRDDLFYVEQTRDGGYILGGSSASGISGDRTQKSRGGIDFWVLKLDGAGNKQWDRRFGGDGWDNLFWLAQTPDGGYALAGTSYSGIGGDKTQASRGDADCWLVKIDAAGNKQWDKTFGGSLRDGVQNFSLTSDGGYLLGAITNSPISGDKTQAHRGGTFDYWVIKLDRAGNKQWDRTLGGEGEDNFYSLQQTTDGGYIVGGYSNSGISGDKTQAGRGGHDYWVVKLNAAGEKVWDKTYGSTNTDYLTSLQQTRDGGYILGGTAEPADVGGDKSEPSKGSGDYWLVKLDGAGNKVWDKSIGGSEFDGLTCVRQTRDGGYVMIGWTTSPFGGDKTEYGRGGWDFWVVKLAPFLEAQRLESFTLIDTHSEQPIRLLTDEDTLHLTSLPRKLSIRADTAPATVGSVTFKLSGRVNRTYTDNAPPYALFGDVKGDYEKWYPAPGAYTLQATPYSKPGGKGDAGTPLTIHFTVVAGPAARLALDQDIPQPDMLDRAKIYPNPTSDGRIRVLLEKGIQGQVRYRLLSAVGRTLAAGSLHLASATHQLDFDFSSQLPAAGLYYLRLEGDQGQQVLKMMRE